MREKGVKTLRHSGHGSDSSSPVDLVVFFVHRLTRFPLQDGGKVPKFQYKIFGLSMTSFLM